ncbi:hypothetical protein GCM10009533_52520 [Saccharopolyspora spinosporotrichia]|uniref:Uncharacterized protein n=1 Tax=Saccharopolyspora erythraea TaxID=1836 RepID=A0ABN1DMB0_SACER|nr:hypothetical protein N599_26200 [Saccharopolyspora erythraea D]
MHERRPRTGSGSEAAAAMHERRPRTGSGSEAAAAMHERRPRKGGGDSGAPRPWQRGTHPRRRAGRWTATWAAAMHRQG